MVGGAVLGSGTLRFAVRPARMMSRVGNARPFMSTVAMQGVTKDVIAAGTGPKPSVGQKASVADGPGDPRLYATYRHASPMTMH